MTPLPRHQFADLAVILDPEVGIVAPLTPCCAASGKGSESPTGVVCRACYRPVDAMFGDCAILDQPDDAVVRISSWTAAPFAEVQSLVASWRALSA